MSALLRANYNYIDDSGRVVAGYRGWDNWSRYISNILAKLIHTQNQLTDISPATQILAIIFMSLAGLCLLYIFNHKKNFTVCELIAVLPLGLNPWFLECFSYKFDSPYMALSVLASIVPFLWWGKKKKFIITSFLGILVMDMTYQASSGIYIMLSLALALQEWTKGISVKVAIHKIAVSAGSYIAAMLVFRIVFMKKATDYATTQTAPLAQMPQTLMQNIQQYFSVLRADLNHSMIVLLLLILLTVLATIIWKSTRNKLQTGIVAGFVILLQAIFSYGGYLFLAKPLMAPRRIYGFGIFITIVMITGLSYAQKNYLLKLETVILAWCIIVLSLTYGNALAEQKRYTEFRIQMVLEDYNHLTQDKPQQERWIQLDGNIGKTESIHRMEKKNPALKRLVPSTFGEKWYWNKHRFFHYYNLKAKSWDEKEKGDMKNMNLPVIIDSEYHKIQSDGTHILITLHE